jgi:two-component system sensor histidine kinase UhpB
VGVYVAAIATLVMVATFVAVGWLTIRTARTAQAELEGQAAKKAVIISKSLDRAIFNLKSAATALSHSRELQLDDLKGFYDLAHAFATSLQIQVVVRDREAEKQIVNTSFPFGASLPGGAIAIAKTAEEEAWRTGKAIHTDVFYGAVSKKHFVIALMPVTSASGKRYSLSVGLETARLTNHLDGAQLGPYNLVTVFDRRRTIVTRSEDHEKYTGQTLAIERTYSAGPQYSTGVVRGPSLQGVAFQWNYARSSQTGWVVSVGTPISVLERPVRDASALLAVIAIVLGLVTVFGSHLTSKYLARKIGRLGVDRPPTRDEFQVLFDSAPYGVVIVDRQGFVALANAQMQTMFGYARDELVGQPVNLLVPDRVRSAHQQHEAAYRRHPSGRPMGHGRELYAKRKEGGEFPVEVSLNPIVTGTGLLTMVTVVDISGRRREQQLASTVLAQREQFQQQLILAEEAERRRLARELHDEAGQSLTAVGLAIKQLEELVPTSGRPRLRSVQTQLEQVGKSLQDVARQMRPASLDDLGLDAALSTYAADWSARYGIEVDLHNELNLNEVTPELAIVIYRIVQEALTNVAKHARGANTVSIIVRRMDGHLHLIIEDDGCGFAHDEQDVAGTASKGIGIPGMRERLALVEGDLQVEATVGLGTTLYISVPLIRQKEPA